MSIVLSLLGLILKVSEHQRPYEIGQSYYPPFKDWLLAEREAKAQFLKGILAPNS